MKVPLKVLDLLNIQKERNFNEYDEIFKNFDRYFKIMKNFILNLPLVQSRIKMEELSKLIRKLKKYYLQLLQKFKIRTNYYITDIKKHFENCLDEIDYKILTKPYKVEFTEKEKSFLKEDIRASIHIKNMALSGKGLVQKEVFTCSLKNIKFIGASGGILYKNRAIVESLFNFSRYSRIRMVDSFILKHRKMKGVYSSIMHYYRPYNHYHWLIDNVPRLFGLMKIKEQEIRLIVPYDINQVELNTLNFILDKRFKLIRIEPNEVWRLEKYYFPSFINISCSGYMPKVYLDFVKTKITRYLSSDSTDTIRNVYISRALTKKKRVLNENKLIKLLDKYDFKVVFAERIPFIKQIEIFKNAKFIISPIGAGLSNIIFSDNLKILELMPPGFIGTHYFMLAKALGFKWDYLIGEFKDLKHNFHINLKKLEEKINKMI